MVLYLEYGFYSGVICHLCIVGQKCTNGVCERRVFSARLLHLACMQIFSFQVACTVQAAHRHDDAILQLHCFSASLTNFLSCFDALLY